jgi:hypothetical protein
MQVLKKQVLIYVPIVEEITGVGGNMFPLLVHHHKDKMKSILTLFAILITPLILSCGGSSIPTRPTPLSVRLEHGEEHSTVTLICPSVKPCFRVDWGEAGQCPVCLD